MQQFVGLFGIQYQLWLVGDWCVEIRCWLLCWWYIVFYWQFGVGSGLLVVVKQVYVFDFGVQYDLCYLCCGVDVVIIEDYCGVMLDVVFCQYCFQLCVGYFILQWFVFYFIGIDIVCVRDMVQQIEFWCFSGGFKYFLVVCWGGGDCFFLLQVVQLLGVDQLFKVWQFLQMVGLVQCIVQGVELGEICLFQLCCDVDVIFWVVVQCDGGIGLELVLFSSGVQLIVVYGVELVGGKIEGLWFMVFWVVGVLWLVVVISVQLGVDGYVVLLLQVGESECWYGFSGVGSGSSKFYEQGECG